MQGLIYATLSLWHLCPTEIQPAPGKLFDDMYFTFVYFVRGKCLLENLDRNEMVKMLGLLTQLHTLGT